MLHIDSFKFNKKGGSDGASSEITKVYSGCVDAPQSSCNSPGIEETIVLHAIVPVKLKRVATERSQPTPFTMVVVEAVLLLKASKTSYEQKVSGRDCNWVPCTAKATWTALH